MPSTRQALADRHFRATIDRGVILMAGWYSFRYSSGSGFLAIDQPRRPKSINDLAEPQRPESFRNRYLHGAIFRKSGESASRSAEVDDPYLKYAPKHF